jgi:hypothetical protein
MYFWHFLREIFCSSHLSGQSVAVTSGNVLLHCTYFKRPHASIFVPLRDCVCCPDDVLLFTTILTINPIISLCGFNNLSLASIMETGLCQVGNSSLDKIVCVVILQKRQCGGWFPEYPFIWCCICLFLLPYFSCLSFLKLFFLLCMDHGCCCNIHNVCRYFQSHTTHTFDLFIVWLLVSTSKTGHHQEVIHEQETTSQHLLSVIFLFFYDWHDGDQYTWWKLVDRR